MNIRRYEVEGLLSMYGQGMIKASLWNCIIGMHIQRIGYGNATRFIVPEIRDRKWKLIADHAFIRRVKAFPGVIFPHGFKIDINGTILRLTLHSVDKKRFQLLQDIVSK